ncbi:hypothetical protein BpHYR1_009669 [Brachionus plicatilis]|uniref:Uncharacterized protein n=1 Tax=Brachionus plicatilis TaxID=10195 RepID=A0A3M7SJV8_BRAPC|nr:hypothetical protein BpHYR1_009669 [Brachionus plicatilis]
MRMKQVLFNNLESVQKFRNSYNPKEKWVQKVSSPLKWQIVGLLKSGDKKQNEIANMLGESPKCVSSTKKRYQETGTVSDRSRSGRPRKLTFKDESYVFRGVKIKKKNLFLVQSFKKFYF